MKILVTGSNGFVGRHLLTELSANGHAPLAFDLAPASPALLPPTVPTVHGDLRDAAALRGILQEHRPDACIHLAGIAFVPLGWTDPLKVFDINTMGTLNLLETARQVTPEMRLLVVSSAEVYGRLASDIPLTEEAPLAPDNLYALSKATADQMTLMCAAHHKFAALTVRPCNHIGPGQSSDFVVPAFAAQLRKIAAGQLPPLMRVGNLESRRTFLDVRDIARAYRLLIERGAPARAYNVAGTDEISIGEVLAIMCKHANVHPKIETDPALYRPTDRRPLLDVSRLRHELDWHPTITLSETLRDIMA